MADRRLLDWKRLAVDFNYYVEEQENVLAAISDRPYYLKHQRDIHEALPSLNRFSDQLAKRPPNAVPPTKATGPYYDGNGKLIPPKPEAAPLFYGRVRIIPGDDPSTWMEVVSPVPPENSDVLQVWSVVAPLLDAGNKNLMSWVTSSGLFGEAQAALVKKKEADATAGFEQAALRQREQIAEAERAKQARHEAARAADRKAAQVRLDAMRRR